MKGHKVIITPETGREIIELKISGRTGKEISEITGISISCVHRYLLDSGVRTYDKSTFFPGQKEPDLPIPEVVERKPNIQPVIIHGKKYMDVTEIIFFDNSNEIYYGSAMEMCCL